jgi:excinuclease ABC A subunit
MAGFDAEQAARRWWNEWYASETAPCGSCHGERLNPTALAVRFRERSIAALAADPVSAALEFLGKLRLGTREREIARDLLAEIRGRLKFLERVGLGYLQLDRAAPTLSGGEAQRIRLAAQLGSNLQGVCYVLDEPTIGLHPRDNAILLESLGELAGHRNTLVVVEHDEDTIRRADHVLDLGPAAGVRGGELVGAGTVKDLIRNPRSITGRFLRTPLLHPAQPLRAVNAATSMLTLERVTLHNVRGIDVRIPLARLVVITGVSGSGKSTVARDVLYANLKRLLGENNPQGARRRRANAAGLRGCAAVRGLEHLDRVLEVDQRRSATRAALVPATYIGFWDEIRPHLRRHLRGRAHPRCYHQPLLLQHRGRALRGLRGPGGKDHRDELPAGREGAVRRVRGGTLQLRDPRGALAREEHRRGAGDERGRGARLLRRAPARASRPEAPAGRGPRLPDARAAEPDALGRGGAAHQAGHRAGEGARGRGAASAPEEPPHALRAR